MTTYQDNDIYFNKREVVDFLSKSNIECSFNPNPERFISRSITQTSLKKFLDCPSCFFNKSRNDMENESEIMLSNTIHFLADFLIRNKDQFPNSHSVLDFMNFEEGNFLEALKTDPENANYELLKYLVELENPEEKERIIKGVLIFYGTAKRLEFEEVRKRDSISLNLKNTKNKSSLTFYSKPDYTGRHKTIYPLSGRTYDNFLIDYKLSFSKDSKSNAIQMGIYYLTHVLSGRKINNYFVLDLTSGNLFKLEKLDLKPLFEMLNKFLILKNLNFRGKNPQHKCETLENIFQENFLDDLNFENFGDSFGSKTYKELLAELKKLEASILFNDLGCIVKPEELEKIMALYPIKIDSNQKD